MNEESWSDPWSPFRSVAVFTSGKPLFRDRPLCSATSSRLHQLPGLSLASGYTAWVDEVFVNAAFRRGGVGRQLMDACEAWAASRECTLVSLATRGAGPFYERLGYATRAEYFKKYLKR